MKEMEYAEHPEARRRRLQKRQFARNLLGLFAGLMGVVLATLNTWFFHGSDGVSEVWSALMEKDTPMTSFVAFLTAYLLVMITPWRSGDS